MVNTGRPMRHTVEQQSYHNNQCHHNQRYNQRYNNNDKIISIKFTGGPMRYTVGPIYWTVWQNEHAAADLENDKKKLAIKVIGNIFIIAIPIVGNIWYMTTVRPVAKSPEPSLYQPINVIGPIVILGRICSCSSS